MINNKINFDIFQINNILNDKSGHWLTSEIVREISLNTHNLFALVSWGMVENNKYLNSIEISVYELNQENENTLTLATKGENKKLPNLPDKSIYKMLMSNDLKIVAVSFYDHNEVCVIDTTQYRIIRKIDCTRYKYKKTVIFSLHEEGQYIAYMFNNSIYIDDSYNFFSRQLAMMNERHIIDMQFSHGVEDKKISLFVSTINESGPDETTQCDIYDCKTGHVKWSISHGQIDIARDGMLISNEGLYFSQFIENNNVITVYKYPIIERVFAKGDVVEKKVVSNAFYLDNSNRFLVCSKDREKKESVTIQFTRSVTT